MASDFRWKSQPLLLLLLLCSLVLFVTANKDKKKKDIRDYNDADMARLLEEWERSPPPVDFSKMDPSKPEDLLKMSKKGRTLMVFASVSGSPTEKETEEITSLWQGSLFNANYDIQRFVVGSNRAIFMLRDGSMAWEVKDFLVKQDRCLDVTVEGQVFPGKADEGQAKVDPKKKNNNNKKKGKKEEKKPDLRGNKASKQEL
ncbi:hypothetical protein CRUP_020936 [Coryphaenoides rupestris]|nr:hypothetical protein CRUP_020936 [Coryphaenoides rupestris]